MNNLRIEKLRNTFNVEHQEPKPEPEENQQEEIEKVEEDEEKKEEIENGEENKEKEEQQLNDEIDSLYYGSYTDSRRSDASRRSQMTSATYISKLEKELAEERKAREKLAKELEEIKKISSEISSHLGLKQVMENNS